MSDRHVILIVDDEEANLQKLRRTFIEKYEVISAESGRKALELLSQRDVSAVITDQRMPSMSGVEFLRLSLEIRPHAVRIILTGYTETEDLMDAINQGQVHRYITKPWDPALLLDVVRRELRRWELEREQEQLGKQLYDVNTQLETENHKLRKEKELLENAKHRLIYRSRALKELLESLDRVVPTDSTVLLQGETGTGKELLARYIHDRSPRAGKTFVPINCGAVPAELVESSFFGHKKGAFTGAIEEKKGYFELADGGTIFLDEIGDAPLDLQVKMLRVLQEGELFPVGAEVSQKINVRVVASTNRNLSEEVAEGRFRQDLFFRLNVFAVFVPPLRARPEDVDVLSQFFLSRFCDRLNKYGCNFESQTREILRSYSWPGNVRELENEVERLVILSEPGRSIPPSVISQRIRHHDRTCLSKSSLRKRLAQLERELILEALRAHDNNRSRAAAALQISRQTIIAKLKEYDKCLPVDQ